MLLPGILDSPWGIVGIGVIAVVVIYFVAKRLGFFKGTAE
jgi:hypothetical protein